MLTWEHVWELGLQLIYRPGLRSSAELQRFDLLKGTYSELLNLMASDHARYMLSADRYEWAAWVAEISQAFRYQVPLGFLSQPLIAATMVFARRAGVSKADSRVRQVMEVFGKEIAHTLLREDYIGLPTIQNVEYRTSANRAHHAAHLAMYSRMVGRPFWSHLRIIEWGGGYGGMARIIRRMNADVTYVIVDVPEVLALQYIYLASVEQRDVVRLVTNSEREIHIQEGMINLVPFTRAMEDPAALTCDGFLSTWALTECPAAIQEFVADRGFFGARHLLLAYLLDANNIMAARFERAKVVQHVPVPDLYDARGTHEYLFS